MSQSRRLVSKLVGIACALAVAAPMTTLAPAAAAPAKVTIRAQLASGYRLLATAKSGKSYLATAASGKVSIANVAAADTNGMSFSILSTSGGYVGPVILKYSTDAGGKKAAKSLGAAKFGFLRMKRATKATVDLKKITVNTTAKFAYVNVAKPPVAVSGKTVEVTAGAPPAAKSLGRTSGVKATGIRKFANPTENALGDDADADGIMAFADVDDDNDGKLDLVDDKFFDTPVSTDKNVNGDAGLYTALICGGECVNLNAFGITKPEDSPAADKALKQMINTFQGVFFAYGSSAVGKSFPKRPDRNFGFFNVDCTGIAWCSGSTSKAVTISPDYDNGTQPANNALPLKDGEKSYTALCGSGVIAKDLANSSVAPSAWPKNDAGTATAYDSGMDEWVFGSCDPDEDKLPNIIPSKGTINSGAEWVNEIKPRMAGPDGLRVGDAIRFALSDSSKALVDSSTQVISGVIQTAPSVRSWKGTLIHSSGGSYTVPDDMQSPSGEVTLTFWRPQRAPMNDESSWQDVGGLTYSFAGPSGPCAIKSAKLSNGTSITPTTKDVGGKSGSMIVDTATDATPAASNFIEITADTTSCGAGATVGQWSVAAFDNGKNSTHFKWQKGGQGGAGQPNTAGPQNQGPGGQNQGPGGQNPGPGGQNPGPGGQNPGPGGQNPGPGGQNPGPGGQNPGPGGQNPGPGGQR